MRRSFDTFPLELGDRAGVRAAHEALHRPGGTPPPLARKVHFITLRMRTVFLMLVLALLLAAGHVRAEAAILLAEIVPSLAGTELGDVSIAPAPAPGATRVVRRSEVLRALERAGQGQYGQALLIPRETRISRELVRVDKQRIVDEAHEALAEAAAPCTLEQARVSSDARVLAGPRAYSAELPKRGASQAAAALQITGAIFVDSGGQRVRVPVLAKLSCPPLDVLAGQQITVIASVGSVRASAPAEARQGGRVGEIIRLTNRATGASLRGRLLDAQTAEVVP